MWLVNQPWIGCEKKMCTCPKAIHRDKFLMPSCSVGIRPAISSIWSLFSLAQRVQTTLTWDCWYALLLTSSVILKNRNSFNFYFNRRHHFFLLINLDVSLLNMKLLCKIRNQWPQLGYRKIYAHWLILTSPQNLFVFKASLPFKSFNVNANSSRILAIFRCFLTVTILLVLSGKVIPMNLLSVRVVFTLVTWFLKRRCDRRFKYYIKRRHSVVVISFRFVMPVPCHFVSWCPSLKFLCLSWRTSLKTT